MSVLTQAFPRLAKHFLNKAETLVVESLQGLASLNPNLGLDTTNKGMQSTRYMSQSVLISRVSTLQRFS